MNVNLLAELDRIERKFEEPRPHWQMDPLAAAPAYPVKDMVVCADGSNWDPGRGAGAYRYDGTTWIWLEGLTVGEYWDDLRFPFTGRNIDVSTGRIDYDYTDLGITFQSNARYNVSEQVSMIAQLPHAWKEGSAVRPHIHWLQTSSADPNWLLLYRVYSNGEAPGSFTAVKWSSHIFTYSSGTLCQITTFPEISMTGKTVSCFIDFKFYRDNDDTSGLFSGNDDSGIGAITVKEFDVHYLTNSPGSTSEYTKGTTGY
jgi:hypothetical protein